MSDEKQANAPEALVEELLGVFQRAVYTEVPSAFTDIERDGIRAVLAHLARRGVEGLPSVDDIVHEIETESENDPNADDYDKACAVHGFLVERAGPLLAARDAALEMARAELDATREALRLNAETALVRSEVVQLRTRAEAAEKRLAAVMGLTEKEIAEAWVRTPGPAPGTIDFEREGHRPRARAILDLIRSRAGAATGGSS